MRLKGNVDLVLNFIKAQHSNYMEATRRIISFRPNKKMFKLLLRVRRGFTDSMEMPISLCEVWIQYTERKNQKEFSEGKANLSRSEMEWKGGVKLICWTYNPSSSIGLFFFQEETGESCSSENEAAACIKVFFFF